MNMNNNYWITRSNRRMYEYLQDSEKVSAEIEKAYRRSEQYIKSETDKIFQNFVQHTGISESEARLLMKTSIGKTAADKLKSALSSVSDESIRKKMLAEINAPAYQARIKRLEELNANIVSECNRLYGTELKLSTDLYTNVAEKAFSRTVYDIQKGTGLGYSFSQLPKSRIDEILRNNWSGKHYSRRIWGNTQKLAENLKSDLLSGMLSGKSGRKIAEDISKRYGVSIKNAERLVRTETNYIANQSELESYKESGIEKYRFVATLDSRTSAVCQQLDGQEFPVSDAQAGVNLPPMHAHCRSTTISVISEKCLENLERRAKNPDGTTSKVPADMSYRDWKNSLNVSNELQQMPLTSVSNSGKLKDIESNITVNTKYFKGKLKHYDITDERINKIPLINLSSLSSEQNIRLQQACKNLLDFMRNEPLGTEGAIILNSSADEINRYKAEKANGNVKLKLVDEHHIAIHNHPSGLIFSEKDVETFIKYESLRILGAVGNNGTVYFIEKTNDFDNYFFDYYMKEIRKDYLIDMPPEEHMKFIEEVMKGAEEYGVKFYTSAN